MNVAYSVSVADAEQFGPAQPPGVRDQQLGSEHRPTHPMTRGCTRMARASHASMPTRWKRRSSPSFGSEFEALAQAESLTPFAIACTVFALLLARIAGGPVPCLVSDPPRPAGPFVAAQQRHGIGAVRPHDPGRKCHFRRAPGMRLHVEAIESRRVHVPEIDAQACCLPSKTRTSARGIAIRSQPSPIA